MVQHVPVVTIDGPSGVGKGTLCIQLATKLAYNFLDSGAVYRILALKALHCNVDTSNGEALCLLAARLDVRFERSGSLIKVILEGRDISTEFRHEKISDVASKVATIPKVREALLHCQRSFRKLPGLVADGRDMGTVVFTDALAKIFLDASAEERAKRRYNQLQEKGFGVNLSSVLNNIKARDKRDRSRKSAPLMAASNALVIDSTRLSAGAVVKKALAFVNSRMTQ